MLSVIRTRSPRFSQADLRVLTLRVDYFRIAGHSGASPNPTSRAVTVKSRLSQRKRQLSSFAYTAL